jgi:hypothetical protein
LDVVDSVAIFAQRVLLVSAVHTELMDSKMYMYFKRIIQLVLYTCVGQVVDLRVAFWKLAHFV